MKKNKSTLICRFEDVRYIFKAGATASDDASRFSFSVLVVYIFKKSTFCYLEPKVVINNNKNNQK